jgi:hypothetical protein
MPVPAKAAAEQITEKRAELNLGIADRHERLDITPIQCGDVAPGNLDVLLRNCPSPRRFRHGFERNGLP